MDELKPFRVETTVIAPQQTVWRHLTEPALIGQWFGWDYEGIDAEIQLIFLEHAKPAPPDLIRFSDGQELHLSASAPAATTVRVASPGEPTDEFHPIGEGWRQFVEQLRFKLARDVSHRRTVYLTGEVTPAAAAVALGGGGDSWHTSRFQQITVDGEGHLAALVTQAPVDSGTRADAMLTVSTFGLDDAAFAAVEDAWTTRWTSLTG